MRYYAEKKPTPSPYQRTAQTSDSAKTNSTYTKRKPTGAPATSRSLMTEIKTLNTAKDYKKALDVWKSAKKQGAEVDEYTYATVLSTYRHLEDYDGALALYSEITGKGIRNSFIDSQILDVFAKKGNIEMAIEFMTSMSTHGIPIQLYAWFGIVRALISDGRLGDAMGMVTQHGPELSKTDAAFWPQLVTTILSLKRTDAAHALLEHVLELQVALPQTSYTSMMHFLGLQDDQKSAALLKRLIEELSTKGSVGYTALIAFYADRNDAGAALDMWKGLKLTPQFFSLSALQSLIGVCAAANLLKETEEIFAALKKGNFEVTSAILAALVRLYASNMRTDEAREHFDVMLSNQQYISPFLFNSMVDMYADLGDIQSAMEIVSKMEDRQMKFNVSLYNSLIALYLRTGNIPKALEYYSSMKSNNIASNFLTYKALLGSPSTLQDSKLKAEVTASIKNSDTISKAGKKILLDSIKEKL